MITKNNEILNKWLPIFVIAALLIVFYKTIDRIDEIFAFISRFFSIISPFLVAVLISYFLYRPCRKLENLYLKIKDIDSEFMPEKLRMFLFKRARGFSVLSVYLIFILAITIIMLFIVPVLIVSLTDLARDLPSHYKNILAFINNLPTSRLADLDLDFKAHLSEFAAVLFNILLDPAKIEQMLRSVFGFANGFFRAFISIIVSSYILLDREKILAFIGKLLRILLKNKTIDTLKNYLEQTNKAVFPFIIGKSLDCLINWIVVTAILLILGVRYAFLLGFIAGLANFIPYLGTLIAVSLISLLTILTGGINLALKTLFFLLIFQQLDANYIEPKIMKAKLKISPILVIFSVIFGGAYFGILGMFLAVPVAAILKQILLEYMEQRQAAA